MSFKIVQFSDCFDVIPSSWLIKNDKFCYWPPSKFSRYKIENLIVTRVEPDLSEWTERAVLQINSSAGITFVIVNFIIYFIFSNILFR